MSETDEDSRYRAPALDKGLDILELLSETEEPMTLKDIAIALERSPTELYRMLDRLARRGYVARRGDSYELSMKLFVLAHRRPPLKRVISHALPAMRRFAMLSGQSCHLVRYDRGDLIVIAQAEAPGYWGMSIRTGARVGLVNTGSGQVLLAFTPPEERALLHEEHEAMPYEIAPPDIEEVLERVRKNGYVVTKSQQTPSVRNLSVPILDANGAILAILTSPFVPRLDNPDALDQDEVLQILLQTQADISAQVLRG